MTRPALPVMALPVMALGLALAATPALANSPRRHILHLDFEGGPLRPGDDTAADEAVCIPAPFRYPFFMGNGAVAEAAMAEARRILAPYGVVVRATPPPPELPYTRARIGGLPEVLGVDELLNGLSCRGIDCGDAGASDTVFVFSDKFAPSAALADPGAARARGITIGRIVVHEAAHAWGLEHAGAGDSIMSKFPSAAADQGFHPGCIPLDLVGDSVCPGERARFCPEGEQDAHAEMLARFGAGGVDDVAPQLRILSPGDGDELMPGSEITLEVEVADDRGEVGWSLHVPELEFSWVAPPGETMRDLVVPAGALTLRVEAIDPDGNIAVQSVQIVVEEADVPLAEPSATCACRSSPGGHGRAAPGLFLLLSGMSLGCRRRVTRSRYPRGDEQVAAASLRGARGGAGRERVRRLA